MSTPSPLSPEQSHALFDILIHHQLYSEIEAFKYPTAITTYGYPFRKEDGIQTTAPLLQNMLNKFALRLPGLNNVRLDFWQEKVKVLMIKLGEAELSESYDKGSIGARKALATAISAILEYVARGMLGGYPVSGLRKEENVKPQEGQKEYNKSDAEDLVQAWDDTVRDAIYGNLLEEAFNKTGETGRLEDHSSQIQATHEYILLNLASFMHHTFVMSPDGQYLLRIIENIHRLIPYTVIRQTLRVGNAATMINGMVRLVLTKISVTAVTNWFGLTNNTNDGMNLLQQIISTVMAWDTAEFQKRAQKLESQRDAPDRKYFKAIKTYVYSSRDRHDAARNISIQESKSIIAVILETSEPSIDPESLSEYQHELLQEHFGNLQSIRDREELTKILCRMQPDLLTSAVKDLVAAFDPVIRGVHNAVNLSDTVTDAENFFTDLIKVSKPKKPSGTSSKPHSRSSSRDASPNASPPDQDAGFASITDPNTTYARDSVPKVEDYVQLLRKHMPSCHKFLHQICKNAPDLASQYLTYAKSCASEFHVHDSNPSSTGAGEAAAGNMTGPLNSIFSSLPPDQQKTLASLLDHHAKHLEALKSTSHSRLTSILASSRPSTASSTKDVPSPKKSPATAKGAGTTHGPGMYLARWHALLDATLVTPATIHGPVRHGWEVKGELDGKGLKVNTLLNRPKKSSSKDRASGRNESGEAVVNMAEGTGDAVERRERKRDGHEEERTTKVWEALRDPWVGVCKGLEVMGDSD